MLAEIDRELRSAARHLQTSGMDALPEACAAIPLEVFGGIQIDRPESATELLQFLPTMPGADVQELWAGSSGHVLLGQSLAVVRTVAVHLPSVRTSDATVLDFGCGWGRLLRLICKFVRPSCLWGVDPWDRSLDLCRDHRVPGQLRQSDWIPRALDVPQDLNFVYAFSVFTHLPEEIAVIALRTLSRHLVKAGRLLLTIRPVEYWGWHDFAGVRAAGHSRGRAESGHHRVGYAFVPHNRPPIEGIVPYGDTSMSVEFVQRLAAPLRLIAVEWSAVDPFQLIVVFEKP
jgi:SAM-dependent methyltransferase